MGSATSRPNSVKQQPDGQAIEQVLREIKTTPVPSGMEPSLWAELTTELTRVLEEQAALAAVHAGNVNDPVSKFTSDTPVNDDSASMMNWDGATSTLSWGYTCTGDYDQNGEVNISDLSRLGQHFGWNSGGAAYSMDIIQA